MSKSKRDKTEVLPDSEDDSPKSKRARIKGLPEGIGIVRNVTGGRKYWQVRLGKKFTGGRIIRKKFDTVQEARDWIFGPEVADMEAAPGAVVDLKERAGGAAFGLSSAQINEAADAFRVLENTKLSLTDAVGYAVRHAIPPSGEMALNKAIEGLCKVKRLAGKNDKYIRGLGWSLGRFSTDFKNAALHKVTRDEVEGWLEEEDFSVATRRNYIRDLHILFKFALGRGWTSENPIAGIEKPADKTGEISIFTPAKVQALLGVAQGEVLAGIAIKTFAGLRTSELLKLDWSDVDEEQIIVKAAHAKTRRRRVVTVSENLLAWLRPLQKETGPVAPFTPRQWHDRVSAAAVESKVAPLPKNVMRHSFCSYHFAKHRNENLTAAEAGNSPAMIYEHYRAIIKKKSQIEEFWAIVPPPQTAETV